MPGILKVKINSAKNLPVMNKANGLTDGFVEVNFGYTKQKTDVYKKSLNPQWNSDWFRFEVEDEHLQDEPLQIRVMDHDTYTTHDAIGKVYIALNPLLTKEYGSLISGWFPIYDTMHGIRGELHVEIKLELFSDGNKFRKSSCGVQFFYTSGIPQTYVLQAVQGFVEELVVNDDPEYQWIDMIRSHRYSNELRQVQFSKLSGELQRKIGLKVLELGGNAVVGYRQCFDLEGESGVVVRAIGTVVTLDKHGQHHFISPHSSSPSREKRTLTSTHSFPSMGFVEQLFDANHLHVEKYRRRSSTYSLKSPQEHKRDYHQLYSESFNKISKSTIGLPEDNVQLSSSPPTGYQTGITISPGKTPAMSKSSDSEVGTPPIASSLAGSTSSGGFGIFGSSKIPYNRPMLQQQSIEMLEYPFFTIRNFPNGFLTHLGGMVSARSVKLLDRIHNPDEPETRDAWWTELRTEIRSHAKALGCHAVIGYSEQTTICGEIIILSASGTAAKLNIHNFSCDNDQHHRSYNNQTSVIADVQEKTKKLHVDVNLANRDEEAKSRVNDNECNGISYNCSLCHIPYKDQSLPFNANITRCAVCRKYKVPDVLFTTIDLPPVLSINGRGCFIQARICREKKESKGESNAKEVSDGLPFMEYELYNQLLNKLKLRGMNSLFGLKIQLVAGEQMIVAIASGTAVYLTALPNPIVPKIICKAENHDVNVVSLERRVHEAVHQSREKHHLLTVETNLENTHIDDDDDVSDAAFVTSGRDMYVLEMDDAEDAAVVATLLDALPPEGFDACTTEFMPGIENVTCNLQMFTQVWRGNMSETNTTSFSSIFEVLLQTIFFKLRMLVPCILGHLDFHVFLHDENDIQITLTGICLGIGDIKNSSSSTKSVEKSDTGGTEDLQFHIDGINDLASHKRKNYAQSPKHADNKMKKEMKNFHEFAKQKKTGWVELTPLSYLPGCKIVSYLGHLNFFIIRESTSVKENGGLSGFLHSFIVEVKAICRAHAFALGGNALIAYQMSDCVLDDHLSKNQSQCLVNVCGDVVFYHSDADSIST